MHSLQNCLRKPVRSAVYHQQRLGSRGVSNRRHQSTSDRLPKGLPVRASELPEPRLHLVGRAIRPSDAEVAANPRARSATLRVAERTAA